MPDPDLERLRLRAARLSGQARSAQAQAARAGAEGVPMAADAEGLRQRAAAEYAALARALARRQRDLSQIHLAAAQLGLAEEDRRLLQERLTGAPSAADMSEPQRAQVLQELKRLGFKPRPRRAPPQATLAGDAQLRKIGALLTVQKLPWTYAEAILRRMRGLPANTACPVGLASGAEKTALITALIVRGERNDTPTLP